MEEQAGLWRRQRVVLKAAPAPSSRSWWPLAGRFRTRVEAGVGRLARAAARPFPEV
jgi:hypothetical protein